MSRARCLSMVHSRATTHMCAHDDGHACWHRCWRCGLTWTHERPVRSTCRAGQDVNGLLTRDISDPIWEGRYNGLVTR